MNHLGSFLRGSTIPLPFQTRDANGALITLAGTPLFQTLDASDLSVIEDDLTASIDHGTVTGSHLLSIDSSDAGYADVEDVVVRVKAGTVDGVSVANEHIASFSLNSGVLPTDAIPGDAVAASAVTKVQSGLATATALADVPTNAGLATALGAADDATLAAIAALNNLSLAQIQAAIAAGDDAVLAAIAALNNLSSTQVGDALAAALATYDPPTKAELDAAVATLATAAAVAALPTAVQVADALLARHQKGGSNGSAGETVADALAGGLMKIAIVDGVMTVQHADGTTAFTRTLTRAALAAIVTSS